MSQLSWEHQLSDDLTIWSSFGGSTSRLAEFIGNFFRRESFAALQG
jgi:hypothetical protein